MDLSGYKLTIDGGRHFSNSTNKRNNRKSCLFSRFPCTHDSFESPLNQWSWNKTIPFHYDSVSSNKDYVEMLYGQHYRLILKNKHRTKCQAKVLIDGKVMGTWVIPAYGEIMIERPATIDKKFTFYKITSQEGILAGLRQDDPNNGLVQVVFTPEKFNDNNLVYSNPAYSIPISSFGTELLNSRTIRSDNTVQPFASVDSSENGTHEALKSNFMQGGTALKGQSHQMFKVATPMELDTLKKVTISVRLVGRSQQKDYNQITPLEEIKMAKSNRIPPLIKNKHNFF